MASIPEGTNEYSVKTLYFCIIECHYTKCITQINRFLKNPKFTDAFMCKLILDSDAHVESIKRDISKFEEVKSESIITPMCTDSLQYALVDVLVNVEFVDYVNENIVNASSDCYESTVEDMNTCTAVVSDCIVCDNAEECDPLCSVGGLSARNDNSRVAPTSESVLGLLSESPCVCLYNLCDLYGVKGYSHHQLCCGETFAALVTVLQLVHQVLWKDYKAYYKDFKCCIFYYSLISYYQD